MAEVKTCFRVIWQFTSEYSPLKPRTQVKKLLDDNHHLLADALLIYDGPKSRAAVSGSILPTSSPAAPKKSESIRKEFLARLGLFLGLSDDVSSTLFDCFLLNEYRGSQRDLKKNMRDERLSPSFILKIRDFYYRERLYLLHILKTLLSDADHEYKEDYASVLRAIGLDALADKLGENLETTTRSVAPTPQSNGAAMTPQQIRAWSAQNLLEQSHLLDLILMAHQKCAPTDRALQLAKLFKEVGFGRYLPNRHLFDPATCDSLVERVSFAQSLIIMDALDFPGLLRSLPSFEKGAIPKQAKTKSLRSPDIFVNLEKTLSIVAEDSVHLSPLMLSIFLCKSLSTGPGSAEAATRRLGAKSLRLNVFQYLLQQLNHEAYSGQSKTASIASSCVYHLLDALLHLNVEEADVVHLLVLSRVLKDPDVAASFWSREGESVGVDRLLDAALTEFPLDLGSALKLLTSSASASSTSLARTIALLSKCPSYTTEVTDRLLRHVEVTAEPGVFRVAHSFAADPACGLVTIPAGAIGRVLDAPQVDASQRIRIETPFNAIDAFVELVTEVNGHIQYGIDSVSSDSIEGVFAIASFTAQAVKRAVSSNASEILNRLQTLVRVLVIFLARFSSLPSPPLDALATALQSAAALARARPGFVWDCFSLAPGFLPFASASHVTSNPGLGSSAPASIAPASSVADVLEIRGMQAGHYGNILATQECAQARYPLTLAFLELVLNLSPSVLSSTEDDQLLSSIVFVLREIFPHFSRWRYFNFSKKEIIGQKCLEIFLAAPPASTASSVIREGVVRSPAAETLLSLLSTGVDAVNASLHTQADLHAGPGNELVKLVRLAFRTLNSTMNSQETFASFPLSLSSSPNVVSTIASYIFLRHDPALPRLAVLLLRRLASTCRMSLLASLAGDSDVIRDALVRCLKSHTEDARIKVAVFEFLTSCVRYQPGVIECFLDIQATPVTSVSSSRAPTPRADAVAETPPAPVEGRRISAGKNSCVPAMVSLIDIRKQGTFQCPAPLLLAVADLVHALWVGGRETAVEVVGRTPSFWRNISAPLLEPVNPGAPWTEDAEARVKVAVVALGILAIELYDRGDEEVDAEFAGVVEKILCEEKIVLWLGVAARIALADGAEAEAALPLLSSIQRLLLVSTTLKGNFKPSPTLKNKIVNASLFFLKNLLLRGVEGRNQQIAVLLASLLFQATKHWSQDLRSPSLTLSRLDELLGSSFANADNASPPLQAGILGALLVLVQMDEKSESRQRTLSSLLTTLGSFTQYALRLFLNGSPEHEAVHVQLNLTTIALLRETFHRLDDEESSGASWLKGLGDSPLAALMSAAQHMLSHKSSAGNDILQATMLLFCCLARRSITAEALQGCGISEHLVIALASSYADKGVGDSDLAVWRLALRLYDAMLRTLQMRFLKDAFDIVGCHHERLLTCLHSACLTLEAAAMEEAAIVTQLLHQLAAFLGEWHLQLGHTLPSLLHSVLSLFQTSTSLLQKPTLLQHRSNSSGEELVKGGRPGSKSPAPGIVSQVQLRLLYIVAGCVSVIRRFTPSLHSILTHPTLDLSSWPDIVSVAFTASDAGSLPSFGTLLACVNSSSSILSKLDNLAESSPKSSLVSFSDESFLLSSTSEPSKTDNATLIRLHALLNYILENSLHVTMAQCSRYLRDPALSSREKQLLKRELSTELNSFLSSMTKVVRKSTSTSSVIPLPSKATSPKTRDRKSSSSSTFVPSSTTLGSNIKDHNYFRLVQVFMKQVLNK